MNGSRWERLGALGGIGFVVLNVLGTTLYGVQPAVDDPPDEVARYFVEHGGGLKAGLVLVGLGSVGLLWWFGSLWRVLTKAEGGSHPLSIVSLAGLIIADAFFMIVGSINAMLALRIDEVGEDAKILYTLGVVLAAVTGFALATHLLATNAIAHRTKMLPMWLVVLGTVSGVAFIGGGVIGSVSDNESAIWLGIVAFLAWCIWLVAVSLRLWRNQDALTLQTIG